MKRRCSNFESIFIVSALPSNPSHDCLVGMEVFGSTDRRTRVAAKKKKRKSESQENGFS